MANSIFKNIYEYSYDSFSSREERQFYISKLFGPYLNESTKILDVGCSENHLKKIYGSKVYGIDINGNPDKVVNLENGLDFISNDFYDFVVCLDVLEHIDNLHKLLNDIIRVSSKYVLIFLPNCTNFRYIKHILLTNNTGKFYGLPLKKISDRHKWFFSYKEIIYFFQQYCGENNINLDKIVLHYNFDLNQNLGFFYKIKECIWLNLVKIFKINNFCQDVYLLLKK